MVGGWKLLSFDRLHQLGRGRHLRRVVQLALVLLVVKPAALAPVPSHVILGRTRHFMLPLSENFVEFLGSWVRLLCEKTDVVEFILATLTELRLSPVIGGHNVVVIIHLELLHHLTWLLEEFLYRNVLALYASILLRSRI